MRTRPSTRLYALLVFMAVTAAACTVTPPSVKVEVVGTPGAGGAGQGQALESTEQEVATAAPEAGGPASTTGPAASGPVRQISAASAQEAAAASRDCRPQASSDPGVTPTEIKLGSTFARSGPVANISGPIEQGVRAYFRAINEAGGICRRAINLVGYDDGWNPQEGKRLIQVLVEDDKVFMLAVVPSSLGLDAATDYLREKGVPAVGTSGLIERQFTEPLLWAAGASTGLSSPHVSIPFLIKERGIKKFAGFYLEDLEVGRLAAAAIHEEIERAGATLCADMVRRKLPDTEYSSGWAAILNQSQSNPKCQGPPEYVFFALDPSGIIKAAKQASWRPTKGWGGGPPAFLDLIPQQVGPGLSQGDTVFQAQSPYLPPIAPFTSLAGVQAYIRTVQKYYGGGIDLKNPYLEGGYCGAAMVVEAIRQAGAAPTRAKVVEVLNNLTNWSCGVSLPMTFRKGNHYGNKSFIGVRLEFVGNAWIWKPEACSTPSDACWRTDSRPGQFPIDKYRDTYQV